MARDDGFWTVRNDVSRTALSRLITRLHDNPDRAEQILNDEGYHWIKPRAHVIGITGVGGGGKSTLIARLLGRLCKEDKEVVVLAIDPTSEKSGGALLADRIRMRDYYLDSNIFIRSLATRGAASSLTKALPEIVKAVRMFADYVVVETAGAGQVDTDIRQFVDTLVVLMVPLGDALTSMKSGQTEHADIVAINTRKGFPGNERFVQEIKTLLGHDMSEFGWQKKIFQVDAAEDEGIDEFLEGIWAHQEFYRKSQSP